MQRLKALMKRLCRSVTIGLVVIGAGACSTSAPDSARRGAIPIDKMDIASLERLAVQFEQAGDAQMALKFYRQALESEPDNARLHAAVGVLYVSLGERERARQHFNRGLESEPYNEKALVGLAGLYIGDMVPQDANHLLARLHAEDKGTARSFNLQAVALDLMQRPHDARRAYAQALMLSPEDGAILGNMALSMAISGEYAAARDILDQLALKEDNAAFAQDALALVAALSGKPDEAYAIAQQSMPAEMAYANRGFYDRLSELTAVEKAWAVFFGRLSLEEETGAVDNTENVHQADRTVADSAGTVSDAVIAEPETKVETKVETEAETVPDDRSETVQADIEALPQTPVSAVSVTSDRHEAAEAIPYYHLQLGSFSNEGRLRRGWNNVKDHPALEGFSPFFERSQKSDDDMVLRLLSGPVHGYRAARAICEALERDNADCVVIPLRPDISALTFEP